MGDFFAMMTLDPERRRRLGQGVLVGWLIFLPLCTVAIQYRAYKAEARRDETMRQQHALLARSARLAPLKNIYSELLERGVFTPASPEKLDRWLDEFAQEASLPGLSIEMLKRMPSGSTLILETTSQFEPPALSVLDHLLRHMPALLDPTDCEWHLIPDTPQGMPLNMRCQMNWRRLPENKAHAGDAPVLPSVPLVPVPSGELQTLFWSAAERQPHRPSADTHPHIATPPAASPEQSVSAPESWIRRSDGMVLRWSPSDNPKRSPTNGAQQADH